MKALLLISHLIYLSGCASLPLMLKDADYVLEGIDAAVHVEESYLEEIHKESYNAPHQVQK